MPGSVQDAASRLSTGTLLATAVLVEPRQLAAKKSVVREVPLQPQQQLASTRQFFLADIGDGQQDAREGSEQLALCCGCLQFGDAAGLIARNAPEAQEPAHGSGHRSNDVTAYAASQMSVVAARIGGEQLLGPARRLLGVMQRRQIAFFDERGEVRAQAGSKRHRQQRVAVASVAA